ncbi:hypothetical protein A7K99_01020 [Tatumella citrea]|uniref:Uncharacterized protein n=1 Tax=Tatumella citrea TaxID=53336 RepID=A0A1Y0LFU5_TATCI|nr:hypothetical protein A7K98_01020 [Tatumella citrea]ARU96539.1 hypothetical protein A7K99_01020 [Tatumella citrea]
MREYCANTRETVILPAKKIIVNRADPGGGRYWLAMATTLTKIAITLPQFIKICEVEMFPAGKILTRISPALMFRKPPSVYAILSSPGR